MNIRQTYVSFDQAVLLKAKGFNKSVPCAYIGGKFFENSSGDQSYVELEDLEIDWNQPNALFTVEGDICFRCEKSPYHFEAFSAPEQWMVLAWLREKYSIHVHVFPFDVKEDGQIVYANGIIDAKGNLNKLTDNAFYNTHEEAVSGAIDFVLKDLI
jgi:hypothetical protein